MIYLSGSLRPDYTPWIKVGISLKIINISTIGHPGVRKEEGFGPGKGESSLFGLKGPGFEGREKFEYFYRIEFS